MFTDAFRPVFTCVHALPPPRAISIKRGSSRADMTRELSPRSRASETMEKVHSPAGGGRSGPEAAGARRRWRLDVGVVRGGRPGAGGGAGGAARPETRTSVMLAHGRRESGRHARTTPQTHRRFTADSPLYYST